MGLLKNCINLDFKISFLTNSLSFYKRFLSTKMLLRKFQALPVGSALSTKHVLLASVGVGLWASSEHLGWEVV